MEKEMKQALIDTSYKGVERLLFQMANKGFMRLQAAKILGADIDDVMGEMQVAYVKAANGFKQDSGGRFTTYCVRVCWNEFNKYAERLTREHAAIGYISTEDIAAASGDEDAGIDMLDCLAGDMEMQDSPEDMVERRQTLNRASKSLSKESKEVLYHLLQPNAKLLKAYNAEMEAAWAGRVEDPRNPRRADDISIKFIGKFYGIKKATLIEVKKELGRVYGIREWNKGSNGHPTYR